jgi:ribosomal protein S18 acetylase RimI-like enzyme
LACRRRAEVCWNCHGQKFLDYHPARAARRRRRHRDDAGGRSARQRAERLEHPLPQSYFHAFEALANASHIQLVVAEDGAGAVVGCLQLCILPGLSSQGASRGLIEDVRVATHCRSRGIGERMVQWAVAEARAKGCKLVELLTHNTRVDAQRFYARLGFQPSHVGMTLRF